MFIKAGYQVQVYITQEALDAKQAVIRYGARKELIVCCGGDGTLNETVCGLMELPRPVTLGYIPSGSTNDFASSLKLPRKMGTAARGRPWESPSPSMWAGSAGIGILCMWPPSGHLRRSPT